MNIYKIRIRNYKSIKDSGEVVIDDNIMAFIGQNNAGKSAILDAIQCVFPSTKKAVNRSDFHKMKLSILVDTFCSKISCPMQLAPMNHSIFYV